MNIYFRHLGAKTKGENFKYGDVSIRKIKSIKVGEVKTLHDNGEVLGHFQILKVVNKDGEELIIELTSKSKENLIKEIICEK